MPKPGKRKTATGGRPADTPYLRADERRAKGKALRERVPRTSHAGWKSPAGRRDPVELLAKSNAGRIAELIPIRFGRMSASPFAFYRGAAALMAADQNRNDYRAFIRAMREKRIEAVVEN